MKEISTKRTGITWNLFRQLEDLDYADDICLLSHTINNMQAKIDHLVTLARSVGLEINIEKTKAMAINIKNPRHPVINNTPTDYVDNFHYLGSIINNSGNINADIESRIKKARAMFGRLQPIWKSAQMSRGTKLRIFGTCVKTTLTYGSETWLVTNNITQKLQVFINKCLRIICKIYWPTTISKKDLWKLVKVEPIGQEIKRKKWKWIGHTRRKPQDSIAREALEWNPQGTRRRGRPNNTWRRTILEELTSIGKTWEEAKITAPNRVRWRCLVDINYEDKTYDT